MTGDEQRNLCVIIPCYNESRVIGRLIEHLHKVLPEARLLAVNDASTDNTAEKLSELDIAELRVLDLPVNLGIGGAVQTGLRYAKARGFKYAVKFDGDGQHLAEEIELIMEPVLKGEADLVIGSRFVAPGQEGFKSTFTRRLGIRVFRILCRIITGKTVTDNTSGFRSYSTAALEFSAENYPAFDYPEPEETVLMLRNGFRVAEIPVKMAERQAGKSSISALKSVYYMVKVFFAVLMVAVKPRVRR